VLSASNKRYSIVELADKSDLPFTDVHGELDELKSEFLGKIVSLADLIKASHDAAAEIAAKEDIVAAHREKLHAHALDLVKVQGDLQRSEAIVQSLKVTVNELELRNAGLQTDVTRNAGLEAHLTHSREAIANLKTELDSIHKQNAASMREIQTQNEMVRTLQSDKDALQVRTVRMCPRSMLTCQKRKLDTRVGPVACAVDQNHIETKAKVSHTRSCTCHD